MHLNRPIRLAFTLIEMLVVIAIIGILIGIAVPSLTKARQTAVKTTCKTNLHQIGIAMRMFQDGSGGRFPTARYMPPPFLSSVSDPPLTEVLGPHLASDPKVFRCPGDKGYVHELSGSSYYYNTFLAGKTVEDTRLVKRIGMTESDVAVVWDFDGGTFELDDGQITVPPFHALRNLLFADSHVGNYSE